MKKILLLAGIAIGSVFNAQSIKEETSEIKNTIKTNVLAYTFRNFNLTYERAINKNIAINATFATIPKGGVPFYNSFVNEKTRADFGDIKMGNTAFTLEARYYFGKKFNSGFYLAPYYRYTKMKVEDMVYDYKIVDTNSNISISNPVDLSGNISANSVGLMLGVQWLLGTKNNWVLDWWIVGGHYGGSNGNLEGKTKYLLTPAQQRELEKELNDLDIPVVKHSAEATVNGANVKLDGPWAGLRSGLSFGYRF